MSEYDYLIVKAERRTQAEAAALGAGGATAGGLGAASVLAPRKANREATRTTRLARASANQGPVFIGHDMRGKGYTAPIQQRGRLFRDALKTGDISAYRNVTTGLSDVNAMRSAAAAGGRKAKAGKLARVLRRGSLGAAALTAAGAAGVGGYEANRRRRG